MIGSINQPPATITSNTRASSYGISRGAMIPEVERAVRNASLISPKRAQNRTPGSFFSANRVVQTHLVRPRVALAHVTDTNNDANAPGPALPLARYRVRAIRTQARRSRPCSTVGFPAPYSVAPPRYEGGRGGPIAGTDHCVLRGEPGHEFLGGRGAAA